MERVVHQHRPDSLPVNLDPTIDVPAERAATAVARAGRTGLTSAVVGGAGFALTITSFLILGREESFPFASRNNPNLEFVGRLARAFLIAGFALLCFYGP